MSSLTLATRASAVICVGTKPRKGSSSGLLMIVGTRSVLRMGNYICDCGGDCEDEDDCFFWNYYYLRR